MIDHGLFTGTIRHQRFLPREHRFGYKFFMWYLNLEALDSLPSLTPWFSVSKGRFGLYRFRRSDYLGAPDQPLSDAVRSRMLELTGEPVGGQVCALMNLSSLGLYFSPVNFYYGFDGQGQMTHFLAEVSNIPWNKRHHYAHYVANRQWSPQNTNEFHVSPFNPMNQKYEWQITPPGDNLGVTIAVDDERGSIFKAELMLTRQPLTSSVVTRQIVKKPIMTGFIVAGIYGQALKLFVHKVPYIPYPKEAT